MDKVKRIIFCSEMLIWRMPYIAQLCNKGIRYVVHSSSRTELPNTNISLNSSNLSWKQKRTYQALYFLKSIKGRLLSEIMPLPCPLHEVFIIGSKINCYHALLEHWMLLSIINDFTASDSHTLIELTSTANTSQVSGIKGPLSALPQCPDNSLLCPAPEPFHNSFYTTQIEVASKNSEASRSSESENKLKWI